MIILGMRHVFDKRELAALSKLFHTIDKVSYNEDDQKSSIDQIEALLFTRSSATLVLNTSTPICDELLRYLEQKGITYMTVEDFLEKYLQKCYIPLDKTHADFFKNLQPLRWHQRAFKALIDYLSVVVLGIIYILLYPIAYRNIQKQSPGDLLFKQTRVGLNNQKFSCIKFRSMHLDAEKDGARFSAEDDPRIFSWGKTMRKYRIDEISQFINIFRGEMSLVGPRPERQHWINQFEKEIPYYNTRHIVKPGITGWAQVMYPYGANVEDAHQKLMYDLYYIKHWSPWLELKTIWKTVMVVLGKQGL